MRKNEVEVELLYKKILLEKNYTEKMRLTKLLANLVENNIKEFCK